MAAAPSTSSGKLIKLRASASFIASLLESVPKDCHFEVFNEQTKEKKTIAAHRKLLAAWSPVFATMFNSTWASSSSLIKIVEVSVDAFETFVSCLYTASMILTPSNIGEIFYLAHKYDVKELVTNCTQFASDHVRTENAIQYATMGLLYHQAGLLLKCTTIITDNTETVLKSRPFVKCNKNVLEHILKMPKMSCKEHIVFDACIEWAKHQCSEKKSNVLRAENLRTELGGLFKLIRFTEMDRQEFMARYETYKGMFLKDDYVGDIFMHFMQFKSCSNKRYDEVTLDLSMISSKFNNNISFNFPTLGETTQVQSYSFGRLTFKLTQSMMLEGFVVWNPTMVGSWRYLSVDISVSLIKDSHGCTEESLQSKTLSGSQWTSISFPRPVPIQRDTSYSISVQFPNSEYLNMAFKQSILQPLHVKSIDFIPNVVGARTAISTLYFRFFEDHEITKITPLQFLL